MWLAASEVRVRSLLGSAQPLADPRFEQVRRELQPQPSSDGCVHLLISPEMPVPGVLGFRRPRILLPADCNGWSADRIRMVLAHELAHVERQDIFWQLVARVSAAVYWFHPLVWLAVGRMRAEREQSCDDRVLLAGVQPLDYATGLVDVAAALIGNETLAIGGIGMASRCQLEDRLRAILDRSSHRGPASAAVRRSLVAGTIILVLALGLLRPFSPLHASSSPASAAAAPIDSKPPATATATPAAEKPAKNSTKATTGVQKKNPLRVVDEQGNPVPDFEIRIWTNPLQSSPWMPGTKGQIAQGQPLWGFDDAKAIDLTIRADGYASTLRHFAGAELEKLIAGQATVVMQPGVEVQVTLRLPPGKTWPGSLNPELYFDSMKNNVRSTWQSSDVGGDAPNRILTDFDMLNFDFDQHGIATVRLTPDTAPFRVAIHAPGFLRFFDRGPFTLADVKNGKLEIDVDQPATLDVRFDSGAVDGEKLPLESDLISVIWKLPEMNNAFYTVAQTEGKPPRHDLRLSDLAAGEYRVYVQTKAKPGIENLPDTGQVAINPGVFQASKNVSLAVGQTERIDLHYTPFDPKAFSGDHTATLHILNADGSPAAGRTVTVTYLGGHYGPIEAFSGTVPDSGIITLSGITDSKPDGMQNNPYKVRCGDKGLGRFGFTPASTNQEFTFHVPPATGEIALVTDQESAPTEGQRNDPSFDTTVEDPAYVSGHPRVLFDEAHNNFHTAGGRYKAFVDLITNDGYRVTPCGEPFTPPLLAKYDILVIANAMAEGGGDADGAKSAFTEDECKAVEEWVTGGGSLLLITDFGPFGSASNLLATRFGVDMSNRVTVDPANELEHGLLFSREKHLLGDHAITNGRNESERVDRVVTFSGQSLQGPPGSVAFLKFADTAVENDGGQEISAAGRAQGVALTHGKGRVVVTGEAAQLSAQIVGFPPERFGMNTPGCDNRQMAQNILHWLSGLTN